MNHEETRDVDPRKVNVKFIRARGEEEAANYDRLDKPSRGEVYALLTALVGQATAAYNDRSDDNDDKPLSAQEKLAQFLMKSGYTPDEAQSLAAVERENAVHAVHAVAFGEIENRSASDIAMADLSRPFLSGIKTSR